MPNLANKNMLCCLKGNKNSMVDTQSLCEFQSPNSFDERSKLSSHIERSRDPKPLNHPVVFHSFTVNPLDVAEVGMNLLVDS